MKKKSVARTLALVKQRFVKSLAAPLSPSVIPAAPSGSKNDGQKPRFSLLPINVVGEVIEVLEMGAAKYSPDNWKYVANSEQRYYDAAMRHIMARQSGEINDPESKRPHLAHALCCLTFWLWHDLNKRRGHR